MKNPGVRISKHNFSTVFSEAWVQAMTPKNILAGFYKTGIYPPDRNSIKLPGESAPSLAQKTGIAYIPLYTPAKQRISHPGIENVTLQKKMILKCVMKKVAVTIWVAGDTNSG